MTFRMIICSSCGEIIEGDSTAMPECPCGGPIRASSRRVTGVFEIPIEMYSVALNPNEIVDFRKRCPGVDVATSGPMMGIPIARTRSQKMQILKAAGFEERN